MQEIMWLGEENTFLLFAADEDEIGV